VVSQCFVSPFILSIHVFIFNLILLWSIVMVSMILIGQNLTLE
jgi:hypothetical protein